MHYFIHLRKTAQETNQTDNNDTYFSEFLHILYWLRRIPIKHLAIAAIGHSCIDNFQKFSSPNLFCYSYGREGEQLPWQLQGYILSASCRASST